jgi:hypothetical protein
MKLRKLRKRLDALLDEGHHQRKKQRAALRKLLRALRTRQRELERQIECETDADTLARLERKRAICRAQREKALLALRPPRE